MIGLMQQHPLIVSSILRHAAKHHRASKIVSVDAAGQVTRGTYPELAGRAAQLAHALTRLGVRSGQRVATLGWNTMPHMAIYYAVSGMGAVLHTVNPRLFPDQIEYILRDAADVVLFVDASLLTALAALEERLPSSLHTVVVMGASASPSLPVRALTFEQLIEGENVEFEWPSLDERAASALCYTSGTTGEPKGVLYSHRSTVLHAMAAIQPDVFALRARDVVMPVVPMFHVNAWGLPYCAPMVGSALVLPGPKLDPASLHALFEAEQVTFSAGVPTIWTGLLQWLRVNPDKRFTAPPRLVVGGTALPVAITTGFQQEYGVPILHAWGMTEISPLGSVNTRKAENADWTDEQFLAYSRKQGRPQFGVDLRVLDEAGKPVKDDGSAFGELEVQGHWVANAYFNRTDDESFTTDGWMRTGDVVTVDSLGSIEIIDRAKDVIKSGGEWISSIALENLALLHPDVQMAAVIPVRHPKWDERPLLLVVCKPGTNPEPSSVLAIYEGRVAKWWIPDAIEFVDSLPLTATGKLWKSEMKKRWKDYSFQS